MNDLIAAIAECIERGKVDVRSPHPPDMKGQEGAAELTNQALERKLSARRILSEGLIKGMFRVGEKFRKNEIYLPDVLMAAKAMAAAMAPLRPFFQSGEVTYKGKIVMGTVCGDLHDIGKKVVSLIFEGGGWNVIDCGVDVSTEGFLEAIKKNNPEAVGLSVLLTTTMISMEKATRAIKAEYPEVTVLVGGAPVTKEYAERIGADFTSPDPQGALDYLNRVAKSKA